MRMRRAFLFVLPVAAAACGGGSKSAGPPSLFLDAVMFDCGDNPTSIAVADFTGDSKPDLVVTRTGGAFLELLAGDGTGTFGSPLVFTPGGSPASVKTADFNGDGHADVAVANQGTNDVSILLGNGVAGSGAFAPAVSYPVGNGPSSLALSDLNGDGKLDIAVVDSLFSSNDVTVLLGTGSTGSFSSAGTHSVGNGSGPIFIAAGELSGDTRPDLVVSNEASDDLALLVATNGGYAAVTHFAVAASPRGIAVDDFDGDGNDDVAVATVDGNVVSVLLGNGAGSLGIDTPVMAGVSPIFVATGDFDDDGNRDLVVANAGGSDVSILLGAGDGSFAPAIPVTVGMFPQSIAVADLNGDGKEDLAVVDEQSTDIAIVLAR